MQPYNNYQQPLGGSRENTEAFGTRSRDLPIPAQVLSKPKSLCRFIVTDHFSPSEGFRRDAYGGVGEDPLYSSKKSYSAAAVPPRDLPPIRRFYDSRFEHREMPMNPREEHKQRSQGHESRAAAVEEHHHYGIGHPPTSFQKLVCPPQLKPIAPHLNYALHEGQHKGGGGGGGGFVRYYPSHVQSHRSHHPYKTMGATTNTTVAYQKINVSFSEDHEGGKPPMTQNKTGANQA